MLKGLTAKLRSKSGVNPVKAVIAVLPAVISILLLGLFPALLNVGMSFTNYNGDISKFQFTGIDNYVNFFNVLGRDVGKAFWNTFRYMAFVIIPLQFIALGAALLVNQKIKGKGAFRAIFFLPSILGSAVVCTIWGIIYDPLDGLASQVLKGLSKVFRFLPATSSFLGDEKMSMAYIAVTALWASYGYSMAIYLAGLQGVPKDCLEAAKLDGANAWQTFWRITLPLIWPAITICLWIALGGTIGMSEYIIFLTEGAYNTTTIGFYMYNMVMRNTASQGQAAAVSLYFFAFTTTIMLLFNKFVRKREVQV